MGAEHLPLPVLDKAHLTVVRAIQSGGSNDRRESFDELVRNDRSHEARRGVDLDGAGGLNSEGSVPEDTTSDPCE